MIGTKDAIKRRLESRALREYRDHLGQVLLTDAVYGYRDENYFDTPLSKPALVRVVPTEETDIVRWCDGHIDPYWDVELLVPHPELVGATSLCVDGTSHCIDGTSEPDSWVVVGTRLLMRSLIASRIIKARMKLAAYIGRLQDVINPFDGATP